MLSASQIGDVASAGPTECFVDATNASRYVRSFLAVVNVFVINNDTRVRVNTYGGEATSL